MKLKKKNPKDLNFLLGCGGTAKGVGTFAGLGVVILQNMKTPGTIGARVVTDNLVDGTALVYFATVDSVSRLIAELTQVREDMKKPPKKLEIIVDATDHKPVGRINKREQTPRKRAKR